MKKYPFLNSNVIDYHKIPKGARNMLLIRLIKKYLGEDFTAGISLFYHAK